MTYKSIIVVALVLLAPFALSQELHLQPTQNPESSYRLFGTQNIYTFLKLDTRVGKIWQVQWGDDDYRFTVPLNLEALATGEDAGRFTLYPTSNIYTFMLLDQVTGETWHVQWGEKPVERFVLPID